MLGHQAADDGVTGFVVGGEGLLLLAHGHRAALGTHQDLVAGTVEVVHADFLLVATCGEQRRLVAEVGQIGTGEARAAACACAPSGCARGPSRPAGPPRPGGRNGPDAATPGPARPDGWSRRSRSRPRHPRSRPFRPAAGSGSARARHDRRPGRHHGGDRRRRFRR
ncbi:hypothetical protein G6F50_015995 [Rhizopus delemar]|uniref:Uncharacterized protein n=1 Tax=Rhizopus delemar TaxID=936053 RepID=A0A9P7C2Q3_9FUNG|nr:hypothetical protein G6F50_015995 [Rhizopus delemar]